MSVKTAGEVISSRDAFFQSYKDPKWKEFSKNVRAFYGNICLHCRASNKITNVHHWKYIPGRLPWEYNMGEVAVLCAQCHDRAHESLQQFRKFIFPRLSPDAFRVINGALTVGLGREEYTPLELAYAIAEMVSTPGSVKRFCAAWASRKSGHHESELNDEVERRDETEINAPSFRSEV